VIYIAVNYSLSETALKAKVKQTLDIIIPVYNPDTNWHKLVVEYLNNVISDHSNLSILPTVVNDGSKKDITSDITCIKSEITNFNFLNIHTNVGKGAAIREALKNSNSDFSLYVDADMPYDLISINAVINAITSKSKPDLVVGVRSNSYSENLRGRRKLLSKMLVYFNKYILRLPIYDTQAGLKAMNPIARDILLSTTANRFLFDLEYMLLCKKNKLILISKLISPRKNIISSKFNFFTLVEEVPGLFTILKIHISTIM